MKDIEQFLQKFSGNRPKSTKIWAYLFLFTKPNKQLLYSLMFWFCWRKILVIISLSYENHYYIAFDRGKSPHEGSRSLT